MTPSNIPLANGQVAMYRSSRASRIPDVDPNNDVQVHSYSVPCPVCGQENIAHSYGGIFFATTQLSCRKYGVFYRPVVAPEHVRSILQRGAQSKTGLDVHRFVWFWYFWYVIHIFQEGS